MHAHKPRAYSRFARIRRRLLALRFAPTVADWEADLRPLASGVFVKRPGGASTPPAMTPRR